MREAFRCPAYWGFLGYLRVCFLCLVHSEDALRINATVPLGQLDELTAEQEYEQALDSEVAWVLESDGTLTRAEDDERQGRAWGRNTGRP